MNINKYTEKAQEAVLAAQQFADREGHAEILPEHLLITLLEQRDGIVPAIVQKIGAEAATLATAVRGEVGRLPRAHGGTQVALAPRLRQVLDAAEQEAERLKDEYVSTEHLLVAVASEGRRSTASRVLEQRGITRDTILQAMTAVRGSQRVTSQNPETTYQALERYGRDLTELARGADALLAEATWYALPEGTPPLHLSGHEAGQHAAEAGVGKLLVTHVWPTYDRAVILEQARERFSGPTVMAKRGLRVDL
jgi:hypothetical protein